MNHFDYSQTINLFEKYKIKFLSLFSEKQKDLADELSNSLKSLKDISQEIEDKISELFITEGLLLNTNDEIEFMGFKMKLNRANPNIPITLDNSTKAYQKSSQNPFSSEEFKKIENKLERITSEFYQIAHRVAHITESLPELESFKAKTVRTIRNHLIEHPEGKESEITYDTFSYSKNEGPFIKGLRIGNHLDHMDKGFKNNCEEFLAEFTNILKKQAL